MASELRAEYGAGLPRLVVAPNGVDAEWAGAEPASDGDLQRLGIPHRYLLFVGNLEPRKNLGTLLRAHAAARGQDPSTPPLVLVGPAGWGDRWQGTAPDPRDVVLAGSLSGPDLRRVVARAAAVCMPSRYEGFGLPVLEALAAGRPVLASDIPAHREIAAAQATLLPADDVDAWAGALAAPEAAAGTEAGRRAHAAAYTWRRSARAHLQAYAHAAGRG
jgi:glycosyltransferase involved in cell wall biosynthesis